MLKTYIYNGATFQFEEGKQPKGAIEVKEAKPQNKARATRKKAANG